MEAKKHTNGESKHKEPIGRFFIGEAYPVTNKPPQTIPIKKKDDILLARKLEIQIIKTKMLFALIVIFLLGVIVGMLTK